MAGTALCNHRELKHYMEVPYMWNISAVTSRKIHLFMLTHICSTVKVHIVLANISTLSEHIYLGRTVYKPVMNLSTIYIL